MLAVLAAAATHRGAVRDHNEDAFVVGSLVSAGETSSPVEVLLRLDRPTVVAVADGMGGHEGGEVASDVVTRHLVAAAPAMTAAPVVADVLHAVNRRLFDEMEARPHLSGMGSTVAGLVLSGDEVLAFNVGDSRVYQLLDGYLTQISVDDALEPADPSGRRSTTIITQALGGSDEPIEPHVRALPLRADQLYVVCSDGLTDMVPLEQMETIASGPDHVLAVGTLLDTALRNGGRDNVSILVLRVIEV